MRRTPQARWLRAAGVVAVLGVSAAFAVTALRDSSDSSPRAVAGALEAVTREAMLTQRRALDAAVPAAAPRILVTGDSVAQSLVAGAPAGPNARSQSRVLPGWAAVSGAIADLRQLAEARRGKGFNGILRDFAIQHPDTVSVVDLRTIACPRGEYRETIEGVQQRIDGVHFTPDAARRIWEQMTPSLLAAL